MQNQPNRTITIKYSLSMEGQKRALTNGNDARRDQQIVLCPDSPEWGRALQLAYINLEGYAELDTRPYKAPEIDGVGRAWRPRQSEWHEVPDDLVGRTWEEPPAIDVLLDIEEKRRQDFAIWKHEL